MPATRNAVPVALTPAEIAARFDADELARKARIVRADERHAARMQASALSSMTSPIRVVPLNESFAISGIADYDVEIHVHYRTPDDATETHNYFASIDGMPGYEACGATERGAAEAMCGRLIADLTKPPEFPGDPCGAVALLASLAGRERARHAEKGHKYGSPESIGSIAREEAYRAATHIIRAAAVLAEQVPFCFGESQPPHKLPDAEARAALVASLCKRLPYMAPEVKATYPADVLAEAEAIIAADAARRP